MRSVEGGLSEGRVAAATRCPCLPVVGASERRAPLVCWTCDRLAGSDGEEGPSVSQPSLTRGTLMSEVFRSCSDDRVEGRVGGVSSEFPRWRVGL
jgi:hypothetical protein